MKRYRSNIPPDVTIRWATLADDAALARLAALDSKPVPVGPVLVAEVAGELWAAVGTLATGSVADPFQPSRNLVELLETRAEQLRATPAPMPLMRLKPLLARVTAR